MAKKKAAPKKAPKPATTSAKVASQAGKDLGNPKTPKADRGPIASALRQAKSKGTKKGKK
jgi:hypothetical protein